jgi:hypothetical protein
VARVEALRVTVVAVAAAVVRTMVASARLDKATRAKVATNMGFMMKN